MSYRVHWHSLPNHPSWVLEVHRPCGLCTPPFRSQALITVGRSTEGFTQINQLQCLIVTTGHQPPTTMDDQLCRGPFYRKGLSSAGLWCPLSLPLECVTGEVMGWLCSDLVCSCLWVHRLWGLLGCVGQGQPTHVFYLGPSK